MNVPETIKQTLKFVIRDVYGKEMVYPVSREAQIFCDLIGQKTIGQTALNHIARLGYVIEWVGKTPQTFKVAA